MGRFIGIDIGAEVLKAVEIDDASGRPRALRQEARPHGKAPGPVLQDLLAGWDWEGVTGAAATGRLARQSSLARIPVQQALAAGFRHRHGQAPATVVSIGGRGFSVLELREGGQERFRENGRCAQGTGNFLQQLVGRFGLEVEAAARLAAEADEAAPLSGRCPVILKTDMTHLANKGEPQARILAGLLDAIAENVQALVKPRGCPPRLLLCGGVARAERIREHFRRFAKRHGLAFLESSPEEARFLEALGAALLARELGLAPPPLAGLLEAPRPTTVPLQASLAWALGRVRRLPAAGPPPFSGPREVLLGFDIGSTGSKAAALDRATLEPLWDAYLPTGGAPVAAAQALMRAFLEGPAGAHPLRGFGVTGSGREIVGSLLASCYGPEAIHVMNEIAAHAEGAVSCDPRVDTIFEIGGQDAKYIRLQGGRVVDAAMNEACSAGTGSFIEEQGRRFAGIEGLGQLAQAALGADACASLGQHCSIFMAEVMDEAVASGVPQARILAGIYDAVVANYLNRVKGPREVGRVVFCQGMPFASDALAAAVARRTGAEVIVPPRPGLMGALGIARLAARELAPGGPFEGMRFLEAEVLAKEPFVCSATKGCGEPGNRCRIERIRTRVAGAEGRFAWGGACALWDRGARRAHLPDGAPDPFRARRAWIAAFLAGLAPRPGAPVVALADEFQLQALFPFYARFLHGLGLALRVAPTPDRATLKRGIEEAAIPFCAPMQQYHGLVSGLAEGAPDFLFLPMVRELPRVDGEAHSALCPISQGAPDVVRLALPGAPRILSPVVDLGPGDFDSEAFVASCRALAAELGATREAAWRPAFEAARGDQLRFEAEQREAGRQALAFCRAHGLVAVAVLGRGYTIHNEVLNSNVPALLREQGAVAVPLECLELPEDTPVFREVFWGHSQRILRAAHEVRRQAGLYAVFCSNYACGPDSFTVPVFAWLMEGKPFAVIETDGHAGDAGTKTRVEAFLHCVREDLRRGAAGAARDPSGLLVGTQAFREVADAGDTLLIPAMGPEAEAAAAVFRGFGVRAEVLPASDADSLETGRRHTSGKECLPLTLTLGSLLTRVAREPEGRFRFLMPTACGPCRLGAYASLDQLVLARLGLGERVRIWSPPWGDYFRGLPSGFSALVFLGITTRGVLEEATHAVRAAEREPGAAEAVLGRWAGRLMARLEAEAGGDLSAARVLRETSSGRAYGIPALLREALADFASVDSGAELPRVLVTGEIYMRLDPFANGQVTRELGRRGLRVFLETCSELLRYADHTAWAAGRKGGLADRLERWVQGRLFGLCQREAERVPFLFPRPPIPALLEAAAPYMRSALEGETVLSLGAPLHAWRDGEIDAVVLVGPLECMPTKLAEAQLGPIEAREGLPSLTLSLGGEAPASELLDAFAFEVRQRFCARRGSPLPVHRP